MTSIHPVRTPVGDEALYQLGTTLEAVRGRSSHGE